MLSSTDPLKLQMIPEILIFEKSTDNNINPQQAEKILQLFIKISSELFPKKLRIFPMK